MSYDLYFWRQEPSITASPEDVLNQLQDGVSVHGVAPLPLSAITTAFQRRFPYISIGDAELNWEGAGSYFQVGFTFLDSKTVTCIAVSCGYQLLDSPDTMNSIIDAANFLGCALYDPQTSQRYEQPEPQSA
ncbi:hypothetical protein ACXR0O_00760 [Verrucomicrobiota bacterium sgz303538]